MGRTKLKCLSNRIMNTLTMFRLLSVILKELGAPFSLVVMNRMYSYIFMNKIIIVIKTTFVFLSLM